MVVRYVASIHLNHVARVKLNRPLQRATLCEHPF